MRLLRHTSLAARPFDIQDELISSRVVFMHTSNMRDTPLVADSIQMHDDVNGGGDRLADARMRQSHVGHQHTVC